MCGMRDTDFLTCIWGDSRWLWLRHWRPLVMEALGRVQWHSQSLLLFPPLGANEGDWTCWNAKSVKGMPSTMYGVFCLTTFSSIRDSKF